MPFLSFRRMAFLLTTLALVALSAIEQVPARASVQKSATGRPVTFAEDLAPIIFESCVPCHHEGGSAATSFSTYEAAKARARQLAAVTESRFMPPWKPDHGYGDFAGERRLTDQQIALFRDWVAGGMPEGDARLLAPAPTVPAGEWQLGPPDLILTMPRYRLRADGADMFRSFVMAVPLEASRYIRAWEFRPGNFRVVHHTTMQVDVTQASRRLHEKDGDKDAAAGYEGLIAPSARAPDGFFLDWAPGHRPAVAVEGTAWPLPAGSDLVMMLHLRPSGKEEDIQASIGLYFSQAPPAKLPVMLRLSRQHLDIPPGDRQYMVTASYTLPVDVDVYTVQPHAHYLGREMRGFARLPNQTITPLISIRDWDFNWQDVYHYTAPMYLPAGTTVVMDYTYDNSADNPRNPNSPPKRATYGQYTTDEMAELWFQVVPRSAADRRVLSASLRAGLLLEEINGHVMMLEANPADAVLHDDLALLYNETGDAAGAIREFSASFRLRPSSPPAAYNVGFALLTGGRQDEARSYFERALQLDSQYALAHYSLAADFERRGDRVQAVRHYREAVRLGASDAQIQFDAGVALARAMLHREAIAALRLALRHRPAWQQAEAALSWTLAVAPDSTRDERLEALRLAEELARSRATPDSAVLDILATALAANGQFDRAMVVGEEALRLAPDPSSAFADAIRRRLVLFRAHRSFRAG
jgi:tetratricopeptide (TPR) repeat protein